MGNSSSRVISTTVANRSNFKIWVKYDFHKNNVKSEQWSVYAFKMWMGVGMNKATLYAGDWKPIENEFQPIDAGDYKPFDIPSKFNKVVYFSAITEKPDMIIICDVIPKKIDKNVVITESLQYRTEIEDKARPLTIDEHSDNLDKGIRKSSIIKWRALTAASVKNDTPKSKSNTTPKVYDATRNGFKRLLRIKR